MRRENLVAENPNVVVMLVKPERGIYVMRESGMEDIWASVIPAYA